MGGESAYSLSVKRSKKSVVFDLKQPEDRAPFFRLTTRAEIVGKNFPANTMNRLGRPNAAILERRAVHATDLSPSPPDSSKGGPPARLHA